MGLISAGTTTQLAIDSTQAVSYTHLETSKDDEEVRERLVKENQDKDALINSQQNELNKASSTIARLRDDIEKKDKEMKRMGCLLYTSILQVAQSLVVQHLLYLIRMEMW